MHIPLAISGSFLLGISHPTSLMSVSIPPDRLQDHQKLGNVDTLLILYTIENRQ
jgi:hypothetical protein